MNQNVLEAKKAQVAKISEVLNKHGLKFVIADDELISQKLLE